MLPIIQIFLFILGTIIASFIGVVVGRIYTGQGFLSGRSRCDACNKPLAPLSLVPVAAYVLGRGRASCCGARISASAPLTEVLLGVLFVLAYASLGFGLGLLFFILSLSSLLALVLYDFAHQILPTPLLAIFVITSAITQYLVSGGLTQMYSVVVTALLIGASLALIHFASRGRAMGLADAPLAFGLALLVGPLALSGFVCSFWIGALIGIALLLARPRGSRMGVEVPFAPFLAAGFLLAYFTQWNLFAFVAASL